jgi:hypothetical protein
MIATLLLAIGPASCGSPTRVLSKSGERHITKTASALPRPAEGDGDIDGGGEGSNVGGSDEDDKAILGFGRPAGAVDRRAIATLIER